MGIGQTIGIADELSSLTKAKWNSLICSFIIGEEMVISVHPAFLIVKT